MPVDPAYEEWKRRRRYGPNYVGGPPVGSGDAATIQGVSSMGDFAGGILSSIFGGDSVRNVITNAIKGTPGADARNNAMEAYRGLGPDATPQELSDIERSGTAPISRFFGGGGGPADFQLPRGETGIKPYDPEGDAMNEVMRRMQGGEGSSEMIPGGGGAPVPSSYPGSGDYPAGGGGIPSIADLAFGGKLSPRAMAALLKNVAPLEKMTEAGRYQEGTRGGKKPAAAALGAIGDPKDVLTYEASIDKTKRSPNYGEAMNAHLGQIAADPLNPTQAEVQLAHERAQQEEIDKENRKAATDQRNEKYKQNLKDTGAGEGSKDDKLVKQLNSERAILTRRLNFLENPPFGQGTYDQEKNAKEAEKVRGRLAEIDRTVRNLQGGARAAGGRMALTDPGEKVRVKIRGSNRTGTVPRDLFDPDKYELLE